MNKPLRIIFAGTPDFGLPCLKALASSKHELVALFTQPDRPSGRGRNMQASAIKTWGLANNIPVYQPINFKNKETIEELASLTPDIIIVIAYGLILPPTVLQIPSFGCINVHASILPKWRGASPIQHAILHGDSKTGVTIMQMDKGMDTGDFYEIMTCEIQQDDTTSILHDRLANLATKPLLNTLENIALNKATASKQDNSKATYAPKINKIDAKINWHNSAIEINQQIRAFNPWPLAYISIGASNLQVLQAQTISDETANTPGMILSITKQGILIGTGKDSLLIEKIRFPGGKIITIIDYLNSNQKELKVGMIL